LDGILSQKKCSTARHDAPIDDDAPSVGRIFDSDQPKAFRESYGGTRLGSADVGAFGNPCDR
jgi:hypothetical protein